MPDYTILLIDYDPESSARLCRPLRRLGYRVEVAPDGLSGIALFHDLLPDLTLIEAMLPKKHGFDVCLELKQTPHGQTRDIWILSSVYKGRKYRNQARYQYKCDQYIEKPISEDEFLASVTEYFAQRVKLEESEAANVTDFDPERRRPLPEETPTTQNLPEVSPATDAALGMGGSAAMAPEMSAVPERVVQPKPAPKEELSERPGRGRLLLWIAVTLVLVLGGLLAATVLL